MVSCGKKQDIVYVDNAHVAQVDISNLQWDKSKFPLRIVVPESLQSQYGTAIQNSANTWNSAMGFTVFSVVFDGPNLVYDTTAQYSNDTACIAGTCDSLYSFIMHPNWFPTVNSNVLAITSFSYDRIAAKMVHADIIFNGKTYQFSVPSGTTFSPSNSMDTESVLTHELGHFLGLKHICKASGYCVGHTSLDYKSCTSSGYTWAGDVEAEKKSQGTCSGGSGLTYSSCIAAGYTWTPECMGDVGDMTTLDSNSIMNRTLGSATIKRAISAKDLYNLNKLYHNRCTVENSLIVHAVTVTGNLPDCEVTACTIGYTPSANKSKCE